MSSENRIPYRAVAAGILVLAGALFLFAHHDLGSGRAPDRAERDQVEAFVAQTPRSDRPCTTGNAPPISSVASAAAPLRPFERLVRSFPAHARNFDELGTQVASVDGHLEFVNSPSAPFQLLLPERQGDPIEFRGQGEVPVRIVERGLIVTPDVRGGVVGYPRDQGGSFWQIADRGYEEWILARTGGDGLVAEWSAVDGEFSQVGEDVVLYDPSGRARVRASAPLGYAPSGETVALSLRVEQGRLELLALPNTTVLADPVWTLASEMVYPRNNHTATLLRTGEVLVAGGCCDKQVQFGAVDKAEIYDPVSGTWRQTTPLNARREGHAAAPLADGRVLVVGGLGLGAPTRPLVPTTDLYSVDAGTWTAVDGGPGGRFGLTATPLESGLVLVTGGYIYCNCDGCRCRTDDAYLFDPATNRWRATSGKLGFKRAYHTATRLDGGSVLLLGGTDPNVFASAEIYSPQSDQFSPSSAYSDDGRYSHSTVLTASGQVLEAGGYRNSDNSLEDALELMPSPFGVNFAGRSQSGGPLDTVLLPSGKVLIVGGLDALTPLTPSYAVQLFDVPSIGLAGTATTQSTRYLHTLTLLADGKALVAGGAASIDGGTFAPSAEIYGVYASPKQVSVGPHETAHFSASGGSGAGYVWSPRALPSGGTIASEGSYSAGATGNVTDIVVVTDSQGNQDTATITVLLVVIAPAFPSVSPRGSITFSVTGGTGPYTWALDTKASGPTAAVDPATGVYVAGDIGGVTDVIRATDSLTRTSTRSISVTAGIAVAPAQVTVRPRNSLSFNATGGNGGPYTWTLTTRGSGGSIDPSSGVYTAGSTGGTTDVVSASDSLGNSGTAEVTVPQSSDSSSSGCATADGTALPWLALGMLGLAIRPRRRA